MPASTDQEASEKGVEGEIAKRTARRGRWAHWQEGNQDPALLSVEPGGEPDVIRGQMVIRHCEDCGKEIGIPKARWKNADRTRTGRWCQKHMTAGLTREGLKKSKKGVRHKPRVKPEPDGMKLEAGDTFTLIVLWCKSHGRWYIGNCQLCMIEELVASLKAATNIYGASFSRKNVDSHIGFERFRELAIKLVEVKRDAGK